MSNRDLEIMADERLQAETVALRKRVEELELALASEQQVRWAAEQDREHWREQCEETEKELDAIRYAAHMPDDYEFGLPSWINQELYGKLIRWTDRDGLPIRRSEDIQKMHQWKQLLLDCWTQFADDTGAGYSDYCLSALERLGAALREAGLIDEAGRVVKR